MELEKLKEEIPCKWRVQRINKHNKTCVLVPYIDSRDAQEKFDEVCGMGHWQSKHHEVKGNVYCEIGVQVSDGNWIWKSDVGSESQIEKEKGEASDSFKRAAVMWGVGRFLYKKPMRTIQATEVNGKWYPYSPEKQSAIYDNDTLSKYVQWLEEKEAKNEQS